MTITRSRKKKITKLETEILEYVSKGVQNRKIAKEMYMSVDTVKVRLSSICKKLNAVNRTHATYIAVKSKLIK